MTARADTPDQFSLQRAHLHRARGRRDALSPAGRRRKREDGSAVGAACRQQGDTEGRIPFLRSGRASDDVYRRAAAQQSGCRTRRRGCFILGNYTQIPIISVWHHPEVDYKYFRAAGEARGERFRK